MSAPPYELFQKGNAGPWFVRTTLPSGTKAEYPTGARSKDEARGVARVIIPQKHAISKAGMKRWRRKEVRADKIADALKAGGEGGPAHGTETPAPSTLATSGAEGPSGGETRRSDPPSTDAAPPPPPPTGGPRQAATGAERGAELAAKLRTIGDGQSIPPEGEDAERGDYVPPGERRDPIEDRIEDEDAELLAEMMAQATIVGWVKYNAKYAKTRKPPVKLNEPNEKCTEWMGQGLRHNYAKLVGRTTALGPTAKLVFGFVGMTISMWFGAEVVTPTSAPPPETSSHSADGANGAARPGAAPAPPNGALSLGRFQ